MENVFIFVKTNKDKDIFIMEYFMNFCGIFGYFGRPPNLSHRMNKVQKHKNDPTIEKIIFYAQIHVRHNGISVQELILLITNFLV